MRNLKFYKWSFALMMLFSITSASAQLFPKGTQRGDTNTGGIFGNNNDRPVILRDGSKQWPDGTVQYPDGTIRYPDGTVRYPDGTVSYPRNQRTQQGNNHDYDHNTCNMPPGQAKKKYGGNAKDYAKGKKNCNCKHGNDDYDDDNRNVSRYPQQYPQQYPQTYPQNRQQYPQQYPQQNPNTKNKKGSRTTNPVL